MPAGADLVEQYLRPLAMGPALAPHVRPRARVEAVSRVGIDRVKTAGRDTAPFVVRLGTGEEVLARAVVDASGTSRTPNPLGANGLPARGEAATPVDSAMPDVLGTDWDQFAGRHTVVVGSGHSAAGTLLALTELATTAPGTRVTWAVRRRDDRDTDRVYGGAAADALPARGARGTQLHDLVDTGRVAPVTGIAVHEHRPDRSTGPHGRRTGRP